jgi:hypothetical protein
MTFLKPSYVVNGAMTISITTLSVITLSLTTHDDTANIMTIGTTMLSIATLALNCETQQMLNVVHSILLCMVA